MKRSAMKNHFGAATLQGFFGRPQNDGMSRLFSKEKMAGTLAVAMPLQPPWAKMRIILS
jgi:hypothetical protein